MNNQKLAVLLRVLLLGAFLTAAGCGGSSGGGEPPILDTDGDGIANDADPDDDNDGVNDTADAFPLDASESVDSDGDGTGDNADPDDDNDGVDDTDDAFPNDPNESLDTDGDGVGNNADPDDDGDGVEDGNDFAPTNPARTLAIQPLFPVVGGEFQLPNTPAAQQMDWIIDQLAATTTSQQDITDRFDPATLAGISAAQWQAFFDTLRSIVPGGTIQDIITMTPTQIRVLVGNANEPANGQFVTLRVGYSSGLIRSFGASGFPLNGSSTGLSVRSFNYTQTADRLATLADDLGVLVARIDETGQCQPIFERNASSPLSTASIFKVWVVGAVARAIEDGVISSADLVPLVADYLTPGGTINDEALGTEFSVTDLAALMLGISDNTATEALFRLVGRDRNEAILTEFNHANQDAMLPFLSMNEAFHLYWTVSPADATAYVSGTEQFQRDYLNNTLTPLGPVTSFPQANASVLVDSLWQASATDVCNAMAGLRRFTDTSEGFALADQAYGAETVGVNIRNRWERVWFKGGSLGDGVGQVVGTYGWLLESDSRGAFAVIAMGNTDPAGSGRIDLNEFAQTALRLVDIVDETN